MKPCKCNKEVTTDGFKVTCQTCYASWSKDYYEIAELKAKLDKARECLRSAKKGLTSPPWDRHYVIDDIGECLKEIGE